jgi:hypothetical protein
MIKIFPCWRYREMCFQTASSASSVPQHVDLIIDRSGLMLNTKKYGETALHGKIIRRVGHLMNAPMSDAIATWSALDCLPVDDPLSVLK